jgi:hypothetical protein
MVVLWMFFRVPAALLRRCTYLSIKKLRVGEFQTGEITLDLGAKLGLQIKERFTIVKFIRNARRVASNPIVSFKEKTKRENDGSLHVGSNVVFVNHSRSAVDKPVCWALSDSFCSIAPIAERGHPHLPKQSRR